VSLAQRIKGLVGEPFAGGQDAPAVHVPRVIDADDHRVRQHSPSALLFRYLVVGGLSIVIDVGLLYVLHGIAGVRLAVATTVAFLVSLVFNFVCNRITMGGSATEQLTRHAVRYGVLVVVNLCITVAVVTGAQHAGVSYLLAKLGVVAAATCWNFALYRRWVFAPTKRRTGVQSDLTAVPSDDG